MLTHIHPFLSITSPINADALVVEGWLPDYALKGAMEEFDRGNYQKIITTGLPLRKGYYLSE
ncbi:MAG: cytosine deaminase, partial [Moorea sp. SIO3I6]|nr:cytosine deaminase [Moorena sp. SIO3I6]